MRKIIFASCFFILAVLLSASTTSPKRQANDTVIAITGRVYYWTLQDIQGRENLFANDDFSDIEGGKYLPLKNTYIEADFAEGSSTYTDDTYTYIDGYYYLKDYGLSAGNYDVTLEIRAKTIMYTHQGKLGNWDTVVSIFKNSLDAYTVNAQTRSYSIHTGDTLTLDIYIGGPQNNLIDDDPEGLDVLTSYWLAQDLSEYYHQFIRLAPDPGEIFWDIYLLYPRDKSYYNPGVAWGKGHIEIDDEDLFPSQFISSTHALAVFADYLGEGWTKLQASARHEYSHEIMNMIYKTMPAEDTSGHAMDKCTNAETAWTEGFALFLPAVVLDWPTRGGVRNYENLEFNYNPYMSGPPNYDVYDQPYAPGQEPNVGLGGIKFHYDVMGSCTQLENGEGEVAAVLWDIYDPKGWEYLPEALQPPALGSNAGLLPYAWKRPLRWFDWMADSYLSDFWTIFKKSPWNLVGNHTLSNDSFWSKWLNEYGTNEFSVHGLKAILFNRGIDPQPKSEHAPSIQTMTIDETNRKINLTIRENDPEDRSFLSFNVGYMKQTDGDEFSYYYTDDKRISHLGSAWQDDTITVSIDIPRGKMGRVNGVLVHDNMLFDYASKNITQPEETFYLACASHQPITFATSVAIQGNIAYVTDMESGLVIYDLSNPLQPVQLSLLRSDVNSNTTPWGGAMDVAVDGSHAYIAAYSGALVIVDASNPSNPVLTGYVAIDGDPRAVALSATKAYVVNGTGGMSIIDIRYPDSPGVDRTLETGAAFDIAISNNQAFVAADGGVQVFSLGEFPNLKGTISISGDAVTGVTIGADGLVYLATRNGSVQIYDISTWDPVLAKLLVFLNVPVNPERAFPIQIGELKVQALPGRILLSGSSLYGAGGVYDVSNPELLYQMASLIGDDFAIKGDVIYSAAGNLGLLAFSRSSQPGTGTACGLGGGQDTQNGYLEEAGTWHGHINDMAFTGEHGYLAAGEEGMKFVWVTPDGMIHDAGVYDQWTGGEAYKLDARGIDISPDGSLVYLTSIKGDLQILNITNEESPVMLGTVLWNRHENVGEWQDVASQYGFVFVCAGSGGLRVLDVREPANLPWKGKFTTAITDCNDVAVSLPIVYALGSSSGLHVFEMIGPSLHTTPEFKEIATWSLSQGISGTYYSSLYLDEDRKLLYVSALWNGVTILDISNPNQPPVVLGSIDPGRAYGMAVNGNILYVGDDHVVHVIDVSDVHHPIIVAEQEITDIPDLEIAATVLKVFNGYLYVATDRDTLQAYRILR